MDKDIRYEKKNAAKQDLVEKDQDRIKKCEALEFGEWLCSQGWQAFDSNQWMNIYGSAHSYTTEDLYKSFKQAKK